MHPAQVPESHVGATIFVNEAVFVANREHCCYWSFALQCYANVQRFPEVLHQAVEPLFRLWGHTVSASGMHKQLIESINERFSRSRSIHEAFAFCPPDFSLNRALVKISKEC